MKMLIVNNLRKLILAPKWVAIWDSFIQNWAQKTTTPFSQN